MNANEIYFDTLGQALAQFISYVEKNGGKLVDTPSVFDAFNGQGVPYGQTVSRSFELASYKGKATRKGAHVSLYRMESGRYELTNYIL